MIFKKHILAILAGCCLSFSQAASLQHDNSENTEYNTLLSLLNLNFEDSCQVSSSGITVNCVLGNENAIMESNVESSTVTPVVLKVCGHAKASMPPCSSYNFTGNISNDLEQAGDLILVYRNRRLHDARTPPVRADLDVPATKNLLRGKEVPTTHLLY